MINTNNKYIEDDPWILPKIDDLFMEMGSNKYFSQIDLKNGFNQIVIDKDSKKYTAFMLLGKQHQYKRITFGIKPGPKMFQRYITSILGDIKNCFVYIDNIVIYSETKAEHEQILKEVLEKLRAKNVRINFEKSIFFQNELKVLGYIVNEEGIFPDTKSLSNAIFDKEIKTKKDVQKLIEVLNWYRKFIPQLSTKIYAISNLLKTKENRNIEQKKTIEEIKIYVAHNAKLGFPDYSKKVCLECDASDIGLGSVLRQEDRIIGYFLKKLSGAELNYSIVGKEYLSIIL